MRVTWLGQSGYLVESGAQRLAIDPFFSDVVERRQGIRRLVRPPCTIASLAPQVLFITHDHLDHYDPETVSEIMMTFPACRLIGPASVIAHAQKDSISPSRLTGLVPGETVEVGSLRLTATPARHSDPASVGLLLRAPTEWLWFSGDSLYFSELAASVRELAGGPPNIAFLCINGRLGNMNLHDAARVVADLRPRVAVPMHYGMFAENTADPEEFRRVCAGSGHAVAILEHGRPVETAGLVKIPRRTPTPLQIS